MSEEFVLHNDLQRDCIEIMDLPLCKLLLCNDSNYPWFIMVPRRSGISDIHQLDWQDQQQLLNESSAVSELLMQYFNGEKMNVAALGNVTPQLHIHHVVRFSSDPSWPKPIWGQLPLKPYTPDKVEEIKKQISKMLVQITGK